MKRDLSRDLNGEGILQIIGEEYSGRGNSKSKGRQELSTPEKQKKSQAFSRSSLH